MQDSWEHPYEMIFTLDLLIAIIQTPLLLYFIHHSHGMLMSPTNSQFPHLKNEICLNDDSGSFEIQYFKNLL